MKLIKLNATASTNTYLKEMRKNGAVQDQTVVVTNRQTAGRGQHNTQWQSHPNDSLTFSVYKVFENVLVSSQFYISMAVAIAIRNALIEIKIPSISIKWPNDIMAGQKKCCGILIENTVAKEMITSSIIGIGLNVNETEFKNLPNATSLFLASGIKHDRDFLLKLISNQIFLELNNLKENSHSEISETYFKNLYKAETVSVFEDSAGKKFNGIIKGVSIEGKLIIETDDEILKLFGLKELKYCF